MPRISTAERSEILDRAVGGVVADGYAVVYRTPTSAVLKTNRKTNHVLHLLLTIFTLGMWGLVWILAIAINIPRTKHVEVDEFGNVSISSNSLVH